MKIDGEYRCKHYVPLRKACDLCREDQQYNRIMRDIRRQQAKDIGMLVRIARGMTP